MSSVDDLNDNCFSLATELIAELCVAFEEEIERPPTIKELCEILCWGIRSCAKDILHDVNVENLEELKPRIAKRRKIVLKRGDVIAVPTEEGDCFLTVYLGLYRVAGDAMGILSGLHPCGKVNDEMTATPVARPIFFHKLAVTSGKWPVVGHRPEWANLFPDPPEYYYAKRYYQNDDHIGPFGSAATVKDFTSPPGEDSPLRHLSEEEAHEIGLLDKDFFQSGLTEEVEAYLKRLQGANISEV